MSPGDIVSWSIVKWGWRLKLWSKLCVHQTQRYFLPNTIHEGNTAVFWHMERSWRSGYMALQYIWPCWPLFDSQLRKHFCWKGVLFFKVFLIRKLPPNLSPNFPSKILHVPSWHVLFTDNSIASKFNIKLVRNPPTVQIRLLNKTTFTRTCKCLRP